jgi:hypothetical protein
MNATPDPTHPTVIPPAPASPGRGRPTLYCPELIECLRVIVRELGCSDSAAAAHAGISVATISRWKEEHEGLALLLAQAREEFRAHTIAAIRRAELPDGRHDWRASAWLLIHLFPEDYSLGRQRRPAEPELPEVEPASWSEPARQPQDPPQDDPVDFTPPASQSSPSSPAPVPDVPTALPASHDRAPLGAAAAERHAAPVSANATSSSQPGPAHPAPAPVNVRHDSPVAPSVARATALHNLQKSPPAASSPSIPRRPERHLHQAA